ncbi:uncharacterized protein LOC129918518 [Episyrphus balteatus]|uniref:uncharacterized protein LOC129918518 n=1 Tax=Episyrphus balteatus TaxID=286459 RepID=UPI002486AE8F|nr:uncharacterized protein LOC129918518 [Episyrphus balteatus]
MDRFLVAFLLIYSIGFCYQQDTHVCPIGTDFYNGACVRSMCPETHYLVNGACLLRPMDTATCGYGFDLINGMCVQQNCPTNFVMINGLCQEKFINNLPPLQCPHGFSVYNGNCLPNPGIIPPPFCRPKPCQTYGYCPFTCDDQRQPSLTTTTPRTTITPTTTTTPPRPSPQTTPSPTTTPTPDICPPEHVVIDGECRFVSCVKGFFHKGRCIEPVCTDGLVWTGLTCAHPEVITTIIEIENNFITETNQTGPDFHITKSIDNIVRINETNEAITNPEKNRQPCTPTSSSSSSSSNSNKKCCFIITPRMCKKYSSKWVCFNRQYRQCGDICGTYSVKYLRVPKVTEHPGMLVIPPNPDLEECKGSECKRNDAVDCSGCLTNQKQTCSPYCYRYRCPTNRCTYIDQSEYCTKYRGSPGCSSVDGCFGSYCYDEIPSPQDDCL